MIYTVRVQRDAIIQSRLPALCLRKVGHQDTQHVPRLPSPFPSLGYPTRERHTHYHKNALECCPIASGAHSPLPISSTYSCSFSVWYIVSVAKNPGRFIKFLSSYRSGTIFYKFLLLLNTLICHHLGNKIFLDSILRLIWGRTFPLPLQHY